MYSTFNCSIAAATSAGLTFANSLGEKSSSAPELRSVSLTSFALNGFCELNSKASMTRARFILVCANGSLDRVGDPICVFVDLIQLASLDQKANFRFGAGITQKHAAFAGELALHFIAQLHDLAQFFNRRFRFHNEIALRLRIL